ncbi:hypothetical protein BASA62_005221 [Batrachochytrium salamandrivorans]|nr:hypothetical protein BASA62_005221 [Batrachochytrium salamandrivorans]
MQVSDVLNNITVGARQLSTYKGRKVTPFLYTPSKIVSQRTEAEMPMAATILSTSTMPIAKNTSDTKPPHRKQYQPADAISSMNQGMYNDALGIIKALSQDTSNDLTVLPRGFYEKLISALHFNTDNAFNTLNNAFKLILKTYLIQGDFDLTCETYAEIKKRGLDRTDRGVLSLMCRAHIQHARFIPKKSLRMLGLNNMPMVWKVYSQVEDLITLHKSAAIGMAKMFGSLDGTGTLGNIKAAICLAMLPHNRTLHNLISGYVANGGCRVSKAADSPFTPIPQLLAYSVIGSCHLGILFCGDAIKALALCQRTRQSTYSDRL